jgi:hypothetical protein
LADFAELHELNLRIWDYEAEFRNCEATGRFAGLPETLRAAHEVNEVRAAVRKRVTAQTVAEHDVEVIEVAGGLDAFADRIAITEVIQARVGRGAEAAEARRTLWLESGLPDIFCGDDFRRLHLANDRLWDVKRTLDAWLYRGDFGVDPLSMARALYLVNDARCQAKIQIGRVCGSPFWETKKYPVYTTPPEWDASELRWRDTAWPRIDEPAMPLQADWLGRTKATA